MERFSGFIAAAALLALITGAEADTTFFSNNAPAFNSSPASEGCSKDNDSCSQSGEENSRTGQLYYPQLLEIPAGKPEKMNTEAAADRAIGPKKPYAGNTNGPKKQVRGNTPKAAAKSETLEREASPEPLPPVSDKNSCPLRGKNGKWIAAAVSFIAILITIKALAGKLRS